MTLEAFPENQISSLPRVYLAGPEVFLPNAMAIGERKKQLCTSFGFEGLYPIDPEADLKGLSPREAALHIGKMNEDLIRSCDILLANITPFRGPSADVGTVYEMGVAKGLNRIVCAYTNISIPFVARTTAYFQGNVVACSDGRIRDSDGMAIEDWGLIDNLMIESCIAHSGGCLIIRNQERKIQFEDLEGLRECLQFMSNQVIAKPHERPIQNP